MTTASQPRHAFKADRDGTGAVADSVVADHPGIEAQALARLSPDDRFRVLEWGFGPRVDTPDVRIEEAVWDWVVGSPDADAVTSGGRTLSYRQLAAEADQVAGRLAAIGVGPGDRVGVFLSRSAEMVIAILGVLRVGASYVPQDARIAPAGHLAHIEDSAGLSAVVTVAAFRDKLTARCPLVVVDDVVDERGWAEGRKARSGRGLDRRLPTDAEAVVIFTSGTTGVPNGVSVSHANLANVLLNKPGGLGIEPGMRVAQLLNIAFDMAVWEILGTLTNGAHLLVRGADIQETASRADVLIGTPSVIGALDVEQCRGVRIVAVAGERCPQSLADTWGSFAAFHNACGPTEVTIVNTMVCHRPGEPLTIGVPLPNTSVYVLDEDLNLVAPGEIGEMWAGGACVTAGYVGNPGLTADRYRADPFRPGHRMFRTRDRARWTADGRLEVHGRTDDQVKVRGGFRVELDAVNEVLERAGGVGRAAAVVAGEGPLAGELVAVVTPADADVAEARAHLLATLPYYCEPRRIVAIDQLPLTPRGKVDRRRVETLVGEAEPAGALAVVPPAPRPPLLPPWRRIWASRRLMHHNRLAAAVVLANVLAAALLTNGRLHVSTTTVSTAVAVNFAAAALIRQQRLINLLFRAATSLPTTAPLWLRRRAGKIYHFGGIHVGAALSASAWYAVQLALAPGSLGAVVMALLLAMVVTAAPPLRTRRHDLFERTHRFAGWAVLLLVAVQVLMQAVTDRGALWWVDPRTWLVAAVVVSVSSTWWTLRLVPVRYERPSSHVALVHFEHLTPLAGSSTAVSRNPLLEWHHFANVPHPEREGFRLTISRSGDFTSRLIDELPERLWVKGIPTAGVGNIDKLFTKVVWVATGSGIGPCLPHLLARTAPAHLLWSTRDPRATYGDDLVDEILASQPDATIWDTTARGKPDLVELAFAAVAEHEAEAVICISNKSTTWRIVEAMEARGIPAYGAIWDS